MRLFNIMVVLWNSASDHHSKFKNRMRLHHILESAKLVFIVPIAVFVLLAYIGSFAQRGARIDLPDERAELPPCTKSADASPKGVLQLTNMIRLITGNQLPEVKTVRFAGLIFYASRKYEVNPLEIIAIIMVESHFKENSINNETGDYGLGQINWEYWGKDLGLTPQELLDPSVNIFLTCHVYKFFGKDFSKYHRGNGIQCNAYLVNVRSILSTLNTLIEEEKENIS